MKFSDFFDVGILQEPFPSLPVPDLPENAMQRKEHIIALASTCYDNGDMLWQDDWFMLADEHLEPLFNYYIQTDVDMPAAMFFFPSIVESSCNFGKYPMWRDAWYPQDDWEYFRRLAFHFVFSYAEENGFGNEMREQFPCMWSETERELVHAVLNKQKVRK